MKLFFGVYRSAYCFSLPDELAKIDQTKKDDVFFQQMHYLP